ncbi:phosphopantetheine-binding protein [Streptomyces sp. UNOC14_S4]|uniref:phosphopantetheine-binding protein n=1 Tax=Streptomyces sp. UNOC14_S4 TaxID=2872340 RepID=UPI001E57EB6E|nr:phosphopantetheine-binding protein [Streptomyces sp. UNOC14_S4]MCC3767697.1 hypothetical protein [Streptomyces sp. UNOC14_S4]
MSPRTPAVDPRVAALITEAVPWADPAAITPTARLREDLGLDSLARVALLARLAEATDTGDDDLTGSTALTTVADLQALHERLSGGTRGAPAAAPADTLGRLVRLLARTVPDSLGTPLDNPLDIARIDPDAPLRELGLPSMVLVDLLVRIEREFAFTWDEDTPPQTFGTLSALARHIDEVRETREVRETTEVGKTREARETAP